MTNDTTTRPPDIVGLHEIALRLGVARTTAGSWVRRESVGFPKPLARLAMGPVWEMSAVQHWHRNYMDSNPTRGRRILPRGRGGRAIRPPSRQAQDFVAARAAARDS